MRPLAARRRTVAVSVAMVLAIAMNAGAAWSPSSAFAAGTPFARWTLDDASGITADDAIGTADGAVTGGATWLTSGAAVGTGALHLDGTNDQVEIANATSLEPIRLVATAWVRGDGGDGAVILEKGAFGCEGPSYGIYATADGIRISNRTPLGSQMGGTLSAVTAKTTLWDGSWHLVAIKINFGTLIATALSIDGSPWFDTGILMPNEGGPVTGIEYDGATSSELRIGGPVNAACGAGNFEGDVDDVRIYGDLIEAGELIATPTSVSGVSAPTGYPGSAITYTAHVSPAPQWGFVEFHLVASGVDINQGSAVPDSSGDVSRNATSPATPGTYELQARYIASGPYLASTGTAEAVVSKHPSTTTVNVVPSPAPAFGALAITAVVTSGIVGSNLHPTGTVSFYDTTGAGDVFIGTEDLSGTGQASGVSTATLFGETRDIGSWGITARYNGDAIRVASDSTEFALTVGKASSSVSLTVAPGALLEANHAFGLQAAVTVGHSFGAESATMTFRRVGVSTPICVVAVNPSGPTLCSVPAQPTGAAQFTATYSGNSRTLGSTSSNRSVTILPDTVHATAVAVQYTTFYPVTDAYKDTVAMTGTRGEPIGVTIKIYTPGGSLIKTQTIAQGSGAYSFAWNGRTSTGTIRAAGKYKVTQTLKDAAGTSTTFTSYVTLSKKKLHTYTKTISKLGSSGSAKGTVGNGTVTINTSSDYTKLYAPADDISWAGAGWELKLPSATIYKSFAVRIYGRHSGAASVTALGAQNFSVCPYTTGTAWNEACFGTWKEIPTTSGTTLHYSTTVNLASTYRSGTKVRLSVSSYGGSTWIYKAQVVVTYAVLK